MSSPVNNLIAPIQDIQVILTEISRLLDNESIHLSSSGELSETFLENRIKCFAELEKNVAQLSSICSAKGWPTQWIPLLSLLETSPEFSNVFIHLKDMVVLWENVIRLDQSYMQLLQHHHMIISDHLEKLQKAKHLKVAYRRGGKIPAVFFDSKK